VKLPVRVDRKPQNIDWLHIAEMQPFGVFPLAELSEPCIIDFVSPRIAGTLRPTGKFYYSPA
jgi:hypothetical protein